MLVLALALIAACTSAPPAPPPGPSAPRAKVPRQRAPARAPAAPTGPPLGVAGPVAGELKMVVEQPAPGGAPTPPQPRTMASLALGFSDGTSAEVPLGAVEGTCVEAPSRPVGPPGKELPSLWSVVCTSSAGATDVHLVQRESTILVVRAQPAGGPPKTVKRIPLAPGAVVARKE